MCSIHPKFCSLHLGEYEDENWKVFDLYKIRKILESQSIHKADGIIEKIDHIPLRKKDIPFIEKQKPTKTETETEKVYGQILSMTWKDDLFDQLMDFFPRSLPISLPRICWSEKKMEIVIKQLKWLAKEINRKIYHCPNDYISYLIEINWCVDSAFIPIKEMPRVALNLLYKKKIVFNKKAEPMVLLSIIKTGEKGQKYAWTLPVYFIENNNTEGNMIYFEQIFS